MSSTNDYVKFVTQQLVRYMDQPKEERVQKRIEKKEAQQQMQDPLANRWFGVLPSYFSLWLGKHRK
ncbi:YqzE family protein [Priestia koreensis]|uniref:YqzE family protein n=1 Tax=Priestia koreensis TaxID=284581 RepID=A0A0M0KYQ9_9BACI|nr:YqzE family protein [Priestia koreensis]KOO43941.1 hypothetical protein AMD01_14535 [Priestia koreensis]MCM3002454.1 YqzE family protein [Priestia koreensis]UNL84173.1 YqzE family protein [Priestia koreensis]